MRERRLRRNGWDLSWLSYLNDFVANFAILNEMIAVRVEDGVDRDLFVVVFGAHPVMVLGGKCWMGQELESGSDVRQRHWVDPGQRSVVKGCDYRTDEKRMAAKRNHGGDVSVAEACHVMPACFVEGKLTVVIEGMMMTKLSVCQNCILRKRLQVADELCLRREGVEWQVNESNKGTSWKVLRLRGRFDA